jgi:hypothetical protein
VGNTAPDPPGSGFRVSEAESIELLLHYTVDRLCGCDPSEPYGMIASTTQQGVIGFDLG